MSAKALSVGHWLSTSFYELNTGFNSINASQFQNSILQHDSVQNLLINLNYHFNNPELLFKALIHSSFIKNSPSDWELGSNERLEFLGDAILGTIISEALFQRCPNAKEGDYSLLRGSLVNEDSLSAISRTLGLGKCLVLSKGEISCGGMDKKSLLADAFEALLAAVFLDSDYKKTKAVCLSVFDNFEQASGIDHFSLDRLENFDPKTKLQEKTMALYKSLPLYKSEQNEQFEFIVSLYIEDSLIGTKTHISKKQAQKELAKKALEESLYLIEKGEQ